MTLPSEKEAEIIAEVLIEAAYPISITVVERIIRQHNVEAPQTEAKYLAWKLVEEGKACWMDDWLLLAKKKPESVSANSADLIREQGINPDELAYCYFWPSLGLIELNGDYTPKQLIAIAQAFQRLSE